MSYEILLFYKFIPIDDPNALVAEQLQLCEMLGLRGRVIVAQEGINGTLSGPKRATAAYRQFMHRDERFADMVFKVDEAKGHAFPRLSVRHKSEIVHFGVEDQVRPWELTGKRLSPKEWHAMLQEEDVVVIDGRNDYEYDIGHFRNAIRPDIRTFREFPEWIAEHKDEWKGKKVLTYCTGGIRCEKLSGYLMREGIDEVYQLDGGIVTYAKDPEVKGHLFDGKCYVFDNRIAVRINQTEEDTVISRCSHCGQPCDRYINCAYLDCHRQHLCCFACEVERHGFCTPECEAKAIAEDRVDPLFKHLSTTGLAQG
ncbi:sulfurtransferase [Alicyclobacillus tengchongensis]|nr:sulfurtransferase [Alicyclobacillus tengchongensis]